jgi:hypothetical protein
MKKLLFLLTLITPALHAVIPEIEIWGDGPTMETSKHFRYLLKDFHRDRINGHKSLQQQEDIVWAAQQRRHEGVFVIDEDPFCYNGSSKKIHALRSQYGPRTLHEAIALLQEDKGIADTTTIAQEPLSPLQFLQQACYNAGITFYNAECGQAIDLYQADVPQSEAITDQEVINDAHERIQELKEQKKENGYSKHYYDLLMQQLNKLASAENDTFIKRANMLRSIMVDATTYNKLVTWKDQKHGFICQGQGHIENLKKLLPKLGYTCLKKLGNDIWKQYPHNYLALPEKERAALDKFFVHHAVDIRNEYTHFYFNLDVGSAAQLLRAQLATSPCGLLT